MYTEAGKTFQAEDLKDIGGFFQSRGVDRYIPLPTAGKAVFLDGVALIEASAATAAQVADAWNNRCASIGLALNTLDAVITKQFDDLMKSIFGELGSGVDALARGEINSTQEGVLAVTGLIETAASASGGDVWSTILDIGLKTIAAFLKALLKQIFDWLKRTLINVLRAALNAAFGCPADGSAPVSGDPADVAIQSGGTPAIPPQLPPAAPLEIDPPPNPMAPIKISTTGVVNRMRALQTARLKVYASGAAAASNMTPGAVTALNLRAGRAVIPGVPGQKPEPVIASPPSEEGWEWWPYALIAGVVGVGIYASKK